MPRDRRSSRYSWLVPLAIAVALAWAYRHSFRVPLLLDDHRTIRDNASLRELGDIRRVLAPGPRVFTNGRPVLNLSFALNYAASGLNLVPYHAVNLSIHWLAAWVLFGLLRRYWGDGPAAAATLLWALHPVQTEAVAYLSQRAESLMGLCYLAMLYAYARATEPPSLRRGWAVAAVGACLAGMLTKETMVTAPVVAMLFDRCLISGSFREAWRRHRLLLLGLTATWLPLAALMVTSGLQTRGVGYHAGASAVHYLRVECAALVTYLKLSVWPHPLVFDYGPHFGAAASATAIAAYAGLVVAAIAGAVWLAVRHPKLGFWALWFFLLLIPTSTVVPIAGQPMAESRLYLPVAGVVVFAVIALCRWRPRAGLVWSIAMAVAACGATSARVAGYRDAAGLWDLTARQRPDNPRALAESANYALLEPGGSGVALERYQRALALDPTFHDAQNDLAALLFRFGRVDEAGRYLRAAVDSDPGDPASHYNLGRVLAEQGQAEAAEAQYRSALALQPDYPEVHNALGALAAARPGGTAAAIAEWETALRERPGDAAVENNLGMLWYHQTGGLPTAEGHFRAAVSADPRLAPAHYNLANTLLRLGGHRAEAIAQYRAALALEPNYAEAHCNLAVALATDPATREEARAEAQTALRVNPGLAPAAAVLRMLTKP